MGILAFQTRSSRLCEVRILQSIVVFLPHAFRVSYPIKPWRYSKKLYKQRYIVECNFRNINQFRRVFMRYDKLDETYNAFVAIANIAVGLKN